ncbi:MAG: putative DNA binding domain-containing protein [Dysosmobacter sp.]|nr:putative DNA binding domain-containing protein [Dysosmobacter sp.]
MTEGITTEFKREYTDEIKKIVVAFANTSGGELLIGVEDDGSVIGVPDVDGTMLQVTNTLRDSIKPDITMFLLCEKREMDGKDVVAVNVQKGTACPYYLAAKGLRPEGVFVRQGASTVPATGSTILKMIKETDGDDYEAARSLNQELTFQDAARFFAEEHIPFEQEQKRTLGLVSEDGVFTNLGLLLSDQCMHTAKLAVFQGSSKTVFKDRAEFAGSLFKQMEDIYAYIDRFNRIRAEFPGLKRVDTRDYPPEALREAMLNAIVHRDYSYSASTFISIFDDRIEFVTLGGLPKGIAMSDVMMGGSVPRNRRLANIFYRLHLIEVFGTGMLKIKECYAGCSGQPAVAASENAFKITLPNVNYEVETSVQKKPLPEKEQRILEYISVKPSASRAEIEAATGLSQSVTVRALKKLLELGLIQKRENGKNTKYFH